MSFKRTIQLAVGLVFGAALASAGSVTYKCDPSIDATEAGTCAYLNSTIAGIYNSTFSNANAYIYITQGITGLGSSDQFFNLVSEPTYVSALKSTASTNAVDAGVAAALKSSTDTTAFGSQDVNITAALAQALGITETASDDPILGINSSGDSCTTPGSGSCYDAIITITTPANLASETAGFAGGSQALYWRQSGGTEPSNAYDFYTTVEHETDEVLGTSSCMDTQNADLSDPCDSGSAKGTPAAVDLFRYNSAGSLALNSSYIGKASAPTGAYFSYNGGVSNGAAGATYNTLSNGDDYADFVSGCPTTVLVQDATGCAGGDQGVNIGTAEINILDAVGYNLTATPEPGTITLFGSGLALLAGMGVRRRLRRN